MSKSELSARINRFLDSKKSKGIDLSKLDDRKAYRGHRDYVDVSHTPFIALAIK